MSNFIFRELYQTSTGFAFVHEETTTSLTKSEVKISGDGFCYGVFRGPIQEKIMEADYFVGKRIHYNIYDGMKFMVENEKNEINGFEFDYDFNTHMMTLKIILPSGIIKKEIKVLTDFDKWKLKHVGPYKESLCYFYSDDDDYFKDIDFVYFNQVYLTLPAFAKITYPTNRESEVKEICKMRNYSLDGMNDKFKKNDNKKRQYSLDDPTDTFKLYDKKKHCCII
jgi:hypothetical protein